MILTIELTPEQESALKAQATARGMELPEFARLRLLSEYPEHETIRKFGTPEEEAADDRAWDEQFAASGDLLERLAAEADEEHAQGRTVPLETFFSKHR